MMINHLTESLRGILQGITSTVSLSTPSDTDSGDAIHLYLFDVRENTELRDNQRRIERRNGTLIIQPPPVRIDCTYLVSATGEGGDSDSEILREHEILSQTLSLLAGMRTIPNHLLANSLKDQTPPLPLITAQPNSLSNPGEFWSAIGAKIRPSLTVTATISLASDRSLSAPTVLTHRLSGLNESSFAIGGRVTDNDDQAVSGARVSVVNRGDRSTTDADGRFQFRRLPIGDYVLRVESSQGDKNQPVSVPSSYAVAIIRFGGDGNDYHVAERQDDQTLVLRDGFTPAIDVDDSPFQLTISRTFADGDLTYDRTTREVTLTDATWPDFDPTDDQVEAFIRLRDKDYPISERTSDAVLVLLAGDTPGSDLSLTDYRLSLRTTFADGLASFTKADSIIVLSGASWPSFDLATQSYDIQLSP